MAVYATPAELEHLRTAPATPLTRRPRFRRFHGHSSPPPPSPDTASAFDCPTEDIPSERWCEDIYSEFDARPRRKKSDKLRKLWRKMSEDTEGVKEFLSFAGQGLAQIGLVWGGAFFLMNLPTKPKRGAW